MAEIVYQRPVYQYYPSSYVAWVINWVVGIIEFMLALRLILELLQAGPSSQFVSWVYSVTSGLVAPFSGAFQSFYFGGFVLDISTLFAMIGYAIIGWLIIRLFSFVVNAFERI